MLNVYKSYAPTNEERRKAQIRIRIYTDLFAERVKDQVITASGKFAGKTVRECLAVRKINQAIESLRCALTSPDMITDAAFQLLSKDDAALAKAFNLTLLNVQDLGFSLTQGPWLIWVSDKHPQKERELKRLKVSTLGEVNFGDTEFNRLAQELSEYFAQCGVAQNLKAESELWHRENAK